MLRRFAFIGLAAAVAVSACKPSGAPKKSGPAVAKGNGFTITADEFKARLDEQSPFIRARYTTVERKKEFLENLIRFEVLAKEAEKQGLANDPDVQTTLKKIMVQKLVQKSFQDTSGASQIPDAELQAYYDEHKGDYFRPKKIRVAAVVFNAPAGTPERAKKLALAKKALAKLKAEESRNTLAFAQVVNEFTEDQATKATSGDLNFKSREELERTYSKDFADAVFGLKPGQASGVIETAQGLYIAKVTGQQEELNRTFEQVKTQIANKLYRERKTKEFDEWQKRLRDEAKVTVDEKTLEAIEVAAGPAGAPGAMPGMGMGGPHGAMPMTAPAQAPAPGTK